jgi:2-keto-4-pentenoate hydratase/2-oxohepta-3-ene-1,7-dioic acid hydratase in catechol pathway
MSNFDEERRKFLSLSTVAGLASVFNMNALAFENNQKTKNPGNGIQKWARFTFDKKSEFGLLDGDEIIVYHGDMFGEKHATGKRVSLSEVQLQIPCVPTKIPALWNNFYQRAAYEGNAIPSFPLFFYKPTSSLLATNQRIRQPVNYGGPVAFEAELGVVIGKKCNNISVADVDEYIMGYTCVNDVTARNILRADSSFVQWDRAKGFDTFCPIGPYIVSGIEPNDLVVRAVLNGAEKQNYPVSDMIFKPRQLVSLISQDTTLYPGDVISCGTSLGSEAMPFNSMIEVSIDGIGSLINQFG